MAFSQTTKREGGAREEDGCIKGLGHAKRSGRSACDAEMASQTFETWPVCLASLRADVAIDGQIESFGCNSGSDDETVI